MNDEDRPTFQVGDICEHVTPSGAVERVVVVRISGGCPFVLSPRYLTPIAIPPQMLSRC